MKSTTHAAVFRRLNEDLDVCEIELPKELGIGQVAVDVHYSGICGSQIGEIRGVKGPDPYLPHLLGHEGAGVVLEVGPGVKTVIPGDHVVMHWRLSSGIQAEPPKYSCGGELINAGSVTTFNEFAVVSENRLTPVPPEFPLEHAILYGCALTTGFGVVENVAKLKLGQSIVVVGAGGVGLNVLQAAALTSGHPIVAVDLFDNRLDLARKAGASHTICAPENTSLKAEILDIVGPSGADVVVDNTGNPRIIEQCYEMTKASGKTVLVGVPRRGDETAIYTLPLHFGRSLVGTHGGDGDPTEDIPRFLALEMSGKFNSGELITDRFSLFEINMAIERMIDGTLAGRCLIDCRS